MLLDGKVSYFCLYRCDVRAWRMRVKVFSWCNLFCWGPVCFTHASSFNCSSNLFWFYRWDAACLDGSLKALSFVPQWVCLTVVVVPFSCLQLERNTQLFGHTNRVSCIRTSPDGAALASVSFDGNIRVSESYVSACCSWNSSGQQSWIQTRVISARGSPLISSILFCDFFWFDQELCAFVFLLSVALLEDCDCYTLLLEYVDYSPSETIHDVDHAGVKVPRYTDEVFCVMSSQLRIASVKQVYQRCLH